MKITQNFKVQGINFSDWFNNFFRNSNSSLFPNYLHKKGFENIMQNIENFAGKSEISINEFVAHFCIMYNETGGSFEVLRELGGSPYCFTHNPPQKTTYNRSPNRLAGNQLKEWGVISAKADVDNWNGGIYPYNAPQEVRKRAENCDFYKFRGWGLNQLTWRANYVSHLEPFLPKKIDEYSHEEFEDLIAGNVLLACKAYHHFLATASPHIAQEIEKGNFVPYGLLVSGWLYYAQAKYAPRCIALRNALISALGIMEVPPRKYAIDGMNLQKAQIKTIQENIIRSQNTDIARLILDNGGADGIWGNATETAFSIAGKPINYFLNYECEL
jgi:hypothetical protein